MYNNCGTHAYGLRIIAYDDIRETKKYSSFFFLLGKF